MLRFFYAISAIFLFKLIIRHYQIKQSIDLVGFNLNSKQFKKCEIFGLNI